MAYGFMATNGNSQILVSDTCKNFHYMGKTSVYNVSNINVVADGVAQSASGTLGYGKRIHYYRLSMPDTVTIPLVFFTMPTTSSYYAISRQYSAGVDWEIEIISYANAVSPELYIFSELTSRSKAYSSWGIKINSSSLLGGPAFDSRFTPLAITTTISVLAPTNVIVFPNPQPVYSANGNPEWMGQPSWIWVRGFYSPRDKNTGTNAWNDGTFNSLLQNSAYSTYITSVPTKPMYHYSSFQVSNQISAKAIGHNRQDLGPWQDYVYVECTGIYWAIFRNAIRQGNGFLAAGWIPEVVGYRFEGAEWAEGGWNMFDNTSYRTSLGANPLTTPNFNQSVSNPVIIADAGFYDNQSTGGYTFFN